MPPMTAASQLQSNCCLAPSVLDPYKEQLAQWHKAESHRDKRERRGIKWMFESLRAVIAVARGRCRPSASAGTGNRAACRVALASCR
jgi:hypothetical protein